MSDAPIYAKTAAGQAEVATRSTRLSMMQRRLLILADGQRGADELARLVPAETFDATIALLLSYALIVEVADAAAAGADALEVPTINGALEAPVPWLDPALALREAKRRAVRELFERLGPDADSLALRIESAGSAEEFRERLRDAERLVSAMNGVPAGQDYLRALRRVSPDL
ncbi:MAG: hypothetical protein RR412_12495 [Burkholderiaceae bacterium]